METLKKFIQDKVDNLKLGLILGTVIPFLAMVIAYYGKFKIGTLQETWEYLSRMGILTKIMSLSVLPNLAFFSLFIWAETYKSARGVLTGTFILAFFVLIIMITQ